MTITKQQILEIASENASLRARMEDMFPEFFEPENACDKYNDRNVDENLKTALGLMGLEKESMFATMGKNSPRGFYLSDYDWKLVLDNDSHKSSQSWFLIPYKRK